jgi:hypothetical protein
MKTFDESTRGRTGVHRATALVVAIGLLLLAAACSDDDGPERANTESVDSSDASNESGGSDDDKAEGSGDDETATEGGGSGGGGGGSGGSGEVLGTARAQLPASAIDNRSTPLRIDVVRLERHGDLVELSLVLTNEVEASTGDSDEQDFSPNDRFGANYDASDIGLVDGAAQKLYLPVVDSDDRCLCSNELGSTEVPPGGTTTIEATYGGVPDDVEQLDVSVPSFPAIVGVSIQ